MSTKTKLISSLGVVLAPWLLAMSASADEQFSVSRIINVPGGLSGFDISFVDPVAGVYVLADSGNKAIDVINTGSNLVINQLKPGFAGVVTDCPLNTPTSVSRNCNGPNGVLIANHTQVWVGDGNSTVWKLQLNNGHVLAKISTALPGTTDRTRADELCYDPDHHIILVANDASVPFPFVTFISSTGNPKVLGQIVMNGKNGTPIASGGIEQCQYDSRTGKFYLNVPQATIPGSPSTPNQDLVLQIDPVSESILKTVNITTLDSNKCIGLRGMAIGPAPQIALGCSNSGTDSVIISEDFSNPKVILTLPGEAGTDENWFNPGDNHYFFANSTPKLLGVVDALGENGSGSPVEDSSATSASGSHSVAADPVGNQVYVPINNSAAAQASKICSTHTDANGKLGVDANGCIAIFTVQAGTAPDDPGSCFQQGGSFANCPAKGN